MGALTRPLAQAAGVTTDFGTNYDAANAVAIQSDGKIVAAGAAGDDNWDFALARFNTNGTLDATFGSGGIVVTAVGEGYDYAFAVAIQTDGKIVAAGATGPQSNYGGTTDKFALVRYNTNGTLDTTFGTGGMGNHNEL